MNPAFTRVRLAELIFGLGLAVFIGASAWIAREFLQSPDAPVPPPAQVGATVLDEPIAVPGFELVDHDGKPFTLADLAGRWSVLFFGYTYCPDICPTTMTTLVQMEERIGEAAGLEQPRFIFVSVDPKRDSPQQLAQYVGYFHAGFTGLTGRAEELRAMTAPLGIYYQADPADSRGNYAVRHSSAILLVDPETRLRALMSPPHDPVVMADDYRRILER